MYANPGSNTYFNSYSSLEPEHAIKVQFLLLLFLFDLLLMYSMICVFYYDVWPHTATGIPIHICLLAECGIWIPVPAFF
jgi:hypothetical protein